MQENLEKVKSKSKSLTKFYKLKLNFYIFIFEFNHWVSSNLKIEKKKFSLQLKDGCLK